MRTTFFFSILVLLSFSACKNPEQDKITRELLDESLPAWQAISDFKIEITNAQFRNVVWVQTPGANTEKQKQGMFVKDDYANLKKNLQESFKTQNAEEKGKVNDLLLKCDEQVVIFKDLMVDLASVADYNDPTKMFSDQATVLDNDGECAVLTKEINADFDWLLSHYREKMQFSKDSLSKMLTK